MRHMRGNNFRLSCLAGFTLLAIVVVFFIPPIPQDPAYHDFVDQRTLHGVPNFWNVASNLPFVIAGLLGLLVLLGRKPLPGGLPELKWAYVVFFAGVLLTGFGSAYYHLDPTNESLVWDRLPMTLAFMAFFPLSWVNICHPGQGGHCCGRYCWSGCCRLSTGI